MTKRGYSSPRPRQQYQDSWAPMRRIRKENHITQAALARAVGVATMTIWRLEHNQHDPSFSVVRSISRQLGVPVWRLVETIETE